VQEEYREQGTRLQTTQRKLAAFAPNLERAEDPKLHLRRSRAGTVPAVTLLKRV